MKYNVHVYIQIQIGCGMKELSSVSSKHETVHSYLNVYCHMWAKVKEKSLLKKLNKPLHCIFNADWFYILQLNTLYYHL